MKLYASVYSLYIDSIVCTIRSHANLTILQHDLLFKELTVIEHIQFYGSLKGVPPVMIETEGLTWLAKVGLEEKVLSLTDKLSGGMKRRLSVAMSLIGNPQVVYLDEPTTGLDPAARRELWKTLKSARQGRLIILSTHFMDEVFSLILLFLLHFVTLH